MVKDLCKQYKDKRDQEEAIHRALACILYADDADLTTWESIRGLSGLKDTVEVRHFKCQVFFFPLGSRCDSSVFAVDGDVANKETRLV